MKEGESRREKCGGLCREGEESEPVDRWNKEMIQVGNTKKTSDW